MTNSQDNALANGERDTSSDSDNNVRPDSSISASNAFSALGLSKRVVRPLAVLGLKDPTPIQTNAIPLVLEGRDVMGLAQTGTGKTAAFGLPLIDRLLSDGDKVQPRSVRALILAPTRELVNQIADNLRAYVKKTPVWVSSVVGGQNINTQIRHLAKGTDVLVATPGRLLDLVDRKAVKLDTAKYLVLDEADQMLDMGFIHALRRIEPLLGRPRQTLLFSATMPKLVEELSKSYLTNPERIEVARAGKAADKVRQSVHYIATKDKLNLLSKLLAERPDDLSLVFGRTKHGCEKLMKQLVAQGFAAASIHGNKSQGQRDRALREFKSGAVRILVATDVAARGIDIPAVSHVYNFNLPEVPENYVHRIGRTARAGRDGEAVAFCAPDERKMLRDIQRLMNFDIEVVGDDGSMNSSEPDAPTKAQRGGRGGGGGGGHRGASGAPKKRRGNARPAGGEGTGSKPPSKKHPRRAAQNRGEGGRGEGGDAVAAPRSEGGRPKRTKPAGGNRRGGPSGAKPATARGDGPSAGRPPKRNTKRPRG